MEEMKGEMGVWVEGDRGRGEYEVEWMGGEVKEVGGREEGGGRWVVMGGKR